MKKNIKQKKPKLKSPKESIDIWRANLIKEYRKSLSEIDDGYEDFD